MKKQLLNAGLAFLCLFVNANILLAQIDTSTYEGKLSYAFQPVNKSFITTNYLEERGAGIVPLQFFAGTLHDSNVVDVNTWRLAYFTMYTGFTGTTHSLLNPVILHSQIKNSWNDTTAVPIAVFYGNYNSVNPNAFTNNQLSISGQQIFDVAGRSGTPYDIKELYLAAPAKTFSSSGTVQFKFSVTQFYTNTNKTVQHLSVDFADGAGYRTITNNSTVTISYTTAGTKRLKIKTVFTDNSSKECYSNFKVAKPAQLTESYPNNPDVQGLRFGNFPNGATVSIGFSRLNPAQLSLTKPLIIIEGYDPILPGITQNFNYNDVRNFLDGERNVYNFNNQLDLVGGYDLVFIDFDNGAADIPANAAIVEQIITWVNQQKVINSSSEQNVVIGISMGGLIGRYALAEMTKNNIATQTRLLITYDSPHRGANVPLGLQHFVLMAGELNLFGFNIRDFVPLYDDAVSLLGLPATQQLLTWRATGATTAAANNFVDGDYRNMVTFLSTNPQPTYRFIATSLGSECANQLYGPGTSLANANANAFLALPGFIFTYRFKTNLQINALPTQGSSSQICRLNLKSVFKLFGIINLNRDIYNNTAFAPAAALPIDGIAGGIIEVDEASSPVPLSFQINLLSLVAVSYRLNNRICFVPRESALDITNYNANSFTNRYVAGISPANPSKANTFIAQSAFSNPTRFNQQHPLLTARNAQWMFNEMENITPNTFNCSADCQPLGFTINGDDALCTSKTYSFNQLPAHGTINWSVAPLGYATLTVNANRSVTLAKQQNGSVTLTATATICGQSYSQTKQIAIGAPEAPSISPINFDASCGTFAEAYSTIPSGTTGHLWNLNYGQTIVDKDNVGSNYFYINPFVNTPETGQTYYNYLSVQAKNACGLSDPSAIVSMTVGPVPSNCGGGGGPIMLRVSPNPTGSSANVEALLNTSFIKLKVLDKFGNLKKEWNYPTKTKKALLNFNTLPQGIYFLKAFDGTVWRTISFIKL